MFSLTRRSEFELGRQVHCSLDNLIVESSLVYFYTQWGVTSSLRAFDMMEEKDVISWAAVLLYQLVREKGMGRKL
ncbi:unnamed protein product [Eruca vesicaria subsp. sativa]|uniref:Pentatricopeptide repeat-containing protein n=1 Tax=Eruca vesicaria subsp. sativa TaxID=29727 RepID=A0ABC8JXV0_ERUVS|nr:unnamed protein product [Eruca vesicaria subsp. sativa]